MSQTHERASARHTDAALDWRQADHDVHVAQRGGEYAGFVERTPDGYRAAGIGSDLGLHPTLAAARAAVAAPTGPRPRWRAARMVRAVTRSVRRLGRPSF